MTLRGQTATSVNDFEKHFGSSESYIHSEKIPNGQQYGGKKIPEKWANIKNTTGNYRVKKRATWEEEFFCAILYLTSRKNKNLRGGTQLCTLFFRQNLILKKLKKLNWTRIFHNYQINRAGCRMSAEPGYWWSSRFWIINKGKCSFDNTLGSTKKQLINALEKEI